jgi:hypothetical protein
MVALSNNNIGLFFFIIIFCKGRRQIKSCTEVAKKKEEKYQQSSPTSKLVYTCNSLNTLYYVSHLYMLLI